MTPTELLAAYDAQLRTDAETPGAVTVERHGPLGLVTFDGGRGLVTYRDLSGAASGEIRVRVGAALAYFRGDPGITRVEWKTRGHDRAPGLHESLVDHGFVPGDPESIMLGDLRALVADVHLPAGVSLRKVTGEREVRAMCTLHDEVFGNPSSETTVLALLRRLSQEDGLELWVAEADEQILCAGRLEPVTGTDFAGFWGGATRSDWRGRGIYRALTAARARSALDLGKTLAHSDSTEFSRPILERAGLVEVSTTTPYEWRRTSELT